MALGDILSALRNVSVFSTKSTSFNTFHADDRFNTIEHEVKDIRPNEPTFINGVQIDTNVITQSYDRLKPTASNDKDRIVYFNPNEKITELLPDWTPHDKLQSGKFHGDIDKLIILSKFHDGNVRFNTAENFHVSPNGEDIAYKMNTING